MYIDTFKLYICLLLCFFACSCGNEGKSTTEFQLNDLPMLEGQQILLNHPTPYTENIELAGNNLIVRSPDGPTFYTTINLRESTPDKNFGFRGHGRNEFIDVRTIAFSEKDSIMYVHDATAHRARLYRIDPDSIFVSEQNLIREIPLVSSGIFDTFPYRYGIVTHHISGNDMFTTIGYDGETMYTFGTFPGDKSSIDDPMAFAMGHQIVMRTSPNGKRFAACGTTSDWLTFYELKEDTAMLIKEYYAGESPVDINITGSGDNRTISMDNTQETKNCFYEVDATDKYLYATYIGLTTKEIKDAIISGEKIRFNVLRFNWDGEYIDGFAINDKVLSLAVASDDSYLIGAVENENGDCIIKQYSLTPY